MDNQKDSLKDKLKLEKLASAVYLITNFLHDADPLKWRLRDKALSLIDQVNLSLIDQLLSLIAVARINPGGSQMNLNILKQEYAGLKDRMSSQDELNFSPETTIPAPKLAVKLLPDNSVRRHTICQIIKQQGPLSIQAISQALPNVSSKTVQRELAELVRTGALKREGERRWSRYLTA